MKDDASAITASMFLVASIATAGRSKYNERTPFHTGQIFQEAEAATACDANKLTDLSGIYATIS